MRKVLIASLILMGAQIRVAAQHSTASPDVDVVPAPRSGLLAVHQPDMRGLDREVREQLLYFQMSLAAIAKEPATTDHDLSEAYGLLGQVYHAYSLTSSAEECYLNAGRLAAKDYRWPYLLANVYQRDARTDEAIKYYRLVRQLRPDYLAAPVSLGNLYFEQNRIAEAAASFKEALAISAGCAAAKYGLGQIALSKRSYVEAARYFEAALAGAPEANRIHYALAMAYRGAGQIEKAKAEIQLQGPVGVRAADPLVDGLEDLIRGERVHILRGRLAFNALRYDEAADEFRKAVASNQDSVPARVNLGSALAKLGDIKGAIEQFRHALRVDSGNAAAHYNLGFLLASLNEHDEAIRHLQTAVELNPKDVEARFLLARELLEAERLDDALDQLSLVVEADPANEDALLDQVSLLMRKKEYTRAREQLEKGHALFPLRGRTAVTLAYLLAANPRYDLRDGARALELAQRVYQTTGHIDHGAIVAMALAELGRCSQAAELQRSLVERAEKESRPDLVQKLRTALDRYEKAKPCRPGGEPPRPSPSGRRPGGRSPWGAAIEFLEGPFIRPATDAKRSPSFA
jgi:tetratricopeptide (TPR) repeat protein